MVRISGINTAGNFGSAGNLYTKREQIDNSEIYIKSKLAKVYERTLANVAFAGRLKKLEEFTGKKIDRIV